VSSTNCTSTTTFPNPLTQQRLSTSDSRSDLSDYTSSAFESLGVSLLTLFSIYPVQSSTPCSPHFCEYRAAHWGDLFLSFIFGSTTTDPNAPNLHPVSERSDHFGKLETGDLEWACSGGFVTETQTFYHFLEDETIVLCQVIHSSIGSVSYSLLSLSPG